MDGMPRIARLPSGEMRLMHSIQGYILINVESQAHGVQIAPPIIVEKNDDGFVAPALTQAPLGHFGFFFHDDFKMAKYVHFRDGTLALFEDTITHANVPAWLNLTAHDVLSAGFVFVYPEGVKCRGESTSLMRYSRREDEPLLEYMLGNHLFV